MTKVAISTLRPNSIKISIQNLTPEQTETILGGIYPPGIGIMNITHSTYLYNSPRLDRTYWVVYPYSISTNENDYNSVDYGRSIYNRFL